MRYTNIHKVWGFPLLRKNPLCLNDNRGHSGRHNINAQGNADFGNSTHISRVHRPGATV